MKFMMLIIGQRGAESPTDPSEEFMAYDQEVTQAGVKVAGAPFDDAAAGVSVTRVGASEPVHTIGQTPEASEYVGGYLVLELPDLATAVQWADRHPGAKYGRVEVRPILEF